MSRTLLGSLIAAAVVALGLPTTADAQAGQGGAGWWEWAAPLVMGGEQVNTRRGPVAIPQPRGDQDRARGAAGRSQGQGPPFCRPGGGGHPVHGQRWCAEKGWGGGYGPIWERRRWDDIVLGDPRDRRTRATMDRGGLVDVLGSVVFGRLQNHGRALGVNQPLTGRWVHDPAYGARILQVQAGGVPIAEFTDLTGDGRADLVLVNPGR